MTRVMAAIAMVCFSAAARQSVPCVIGGDVRDADTGKPVSRARVMADVPGSHSFVQLTDAEGNFCFAKLPPDTYRVVVQKEAYTSLEHPVKLAIEEGTVVKPLELRLTRYARLAGMVVDELGETVPGAEITVWQQSRAKTDPAPDEVDSATADARGAFRVSQLEPGTYYLSVRPASDNRQRTALTFLDSSGQVPREREVETFYSSSFTLADANPVELAAGQQIHDLVLTLKKTRLRQITGRIAQPPPAGQLFCVGESESTSAGVALTIGRDGEFARVDLLPAVYSCRLRVGDRVIAQKSVDLTNGDAAAVTLDPIETVDVPVVIRTEGKGRAFRPRAKSASLLLVQDGSSEAAALESAPEGGLHFSAVPRGVYRVHLELEGQKLYLKAIAYGGETQTGDKVDLRTPRPGPLEFTFSSNVAELQGRIQPADGAGETLSEPVALILVDAAMSDAEIVGARQTSTDQNGRYRLANVAPGKYRLFAIAGFDQDAWGNPDLVKALAAKAVEVELKENEKKQVVVPVIPAGEWHAAVKKGG